MPVPVDQPPYSGMQSGIRGLRLEATDVRAEFKYAGHRSADHRADVDDRLVERGQGLAVTTARQQLRRPDHTGPWKT
ncbi:hypothetical protein ACH4MM_05765 [Streptomyces pratensis]|uniref:hypothetical protein n=1 Tax=Streptomyces pratensis TaxID=1169025 RepID=UPI003799387A